MYIYIHIHTYVCVYAPQYVICMYMYMYACIHVCMYVYIRMYVCLAHPFRRDWSNFVNMIYACIYKYVCIKTTKCLLRENGMGGLVRT
jgi:hypothetical protein